MQTPPANVYEFGEFQLDTAKRLLRRLDGTPVPLTSRVFETLLYMVEHHDAVMDKERIMAVVWPDSIVEENNLAQAISKLRQVFGETPGSHNYIVTVPGRGYRFVAKVAEHATEAASPANAEHVQSLTSASNGAEAGTRAERHPPRAKTGWLLPAAVSAIVLAGLGAFFFIRYGSLPVDVAPTSSVPARVVPSVSTPIPEKSVAVLPFENLSDDKQNFYFAVGVQDEIMSDLARIADLKVISRTSANLYKSGNGRNSREIGRQLGVAHLLEGSVQRMGNQLRVNAQLIEARTDTHVWAQTYDRDVTDLFAVQSEIAKAIAEQLHAKISPSEKLAIEQPPTTDLTAFDLYSRAKSLLMAVSFTLKTKANLLQAADLLNKAVEHDPTFFQAYCHLAYAHDRLYFDGFDRTPARLSLAEAAIQAAFRLRPDSGETHLARAENLYRGHLDYYGALAELEVARQSLPNDARVLQLMAFIQRRQGRWDESTRNLERAVDLDPRNNDLLTQTALSYHYLRRYVDEDAMLERALAIDPNSIGLKVSRAGLEFDWKANTQPVHQLIDELRAKDPSAMQSVADEWLYCALAERDPAAAASALAALGENSLGTTTVKYSPRFVEGLIARMTKDDGRARAAFTAARAEQEKLVRANPDDAGALCVLGSIDAAIGRKEEALREGQRAVELLPMEKDAIKGTRMIICLARIAAWIGDNDLACRQLARASSLPSGVSYGELKLLPWYDPLRGEPCFEQIVASLAPKGN
jgi:TolB-like protein/DNA-binding winged helix-turn-helix (wHTH) protein/cytochrome c-type biogenesis protein CcmH/NrfG